MKCIDCDDFGGNCKNPENICEKYKKTIHRTYTKLNKAENGIYEFQKMEVEDGKNNN